MTFSDLLNLWDKYKQQHGTEAYRHVSELLKEAKEQHRRDFLKLKPQGDHEQSWKGFKGNNLEKLIINILKDEMESLGLRMVRGNSLERARSSNLSQELSRVKRNIAVDYGEQGLHIPDLDIIIYESETGTVFAGVSSKVTLRERIAQTGYWKIKLSQDTVTSQIKVYFFTLDEDGTLTVSQPAKKGRAIVEVDTDGGYVLTEEEIEESDKVKMFDKFILDLRVLIAERRAGS